VRLVPYETLDVLWVTGRDESRIETHGGCNHERVDRVSGAELGFREQVTGDARYLLGQRHDEKTPSIEKVVDGSVVARATADLRQNGRRHPHQRAALVSYGEHRPGPFGVDSTRTWPSKNVSPVQMPSSNSWAMPSLSHTGMLGLIARWANW